ncbi:MAG: glycosyltransferase [Roseburia sp.]|nr:glycosyltransferase [Roseburia sp.]MCM1420457.1 glycosyltransferase [Bacteroides sp.]
MYYKRTKMKKCDNNKNKLTIIIPFVNEGDEVENTIISILDNSNNDVEIIVINDASDDNIDYEQKLRKYPIRYTCNHKRIGVAASRDKGVRLCETDYFLLLDAHMRFYNSGWVHSIVQELNKNSELLLCAQTKVLKKENGIIIENQHFRNYWGAYVNFYTPICFLEAQWTYSDWSLPKEKRDAQIIPCILGAGYATSKSYWLYLCGLEGLLSYGSDEVLISMKVWLAGGQCKLMPNVVIGHIYRCSSPYEHYTERRIYNRIFISQLLCSVTIQKKLFAIEKIKHPQEYWDAWKLYYDNLDFVIRNALSFKKKIKKEFSSFEKFNSSYKYIDREPIEKKEKFLLRCVIYIVSYMNSTNRIGLLNGKMGIVILLFYYAKYKKNIYIANLANKFLKEVINNINIYDSLTISDGLLGIGWAVCYLFQQRFISDNINEFLYSIDQRVLEISPCRMVDLNIDYGLGGVLRYVLCRLYNTNDVSETGLSLVFLSDLYNCAKKVIDENLFNTCPETYVEYILFYEKKIEMSPASIYEILMLPGWNRYSKNVKDISLRGLTGMCLEYLLTTSIE